MKGRAARENLFVGGLHVGVRADDSRDLPVEKTSHGDFFAGRFAVEHRRGCYGVSFRISATASSMARNGFSRIGCMKVRRLHVDHAHLAFAVSSTIDAAPGRTFGIIYRPQKARLRVR